MGYSILNKTGNGTSNSFTLEFTLGYLKEDNVTCQVGDEVDERSITFTPGNPNLVTVDGDIIGDGVEVTFKRVVSKDELLYDFQKQDPIDEISLDESHMQLMMSMHEVLDGVGLTDVLVDINMHGNKLTNVYTDLEDDDSLVTVGAISTQLSEMNTARNEAVTAANEAEISKDDAASSATAAAASATSAASDADDASDLKDATEIFANAASSSASSASAAASVALTRANNAASSAAAASDSKDACDTAVSVASVYAETYQNLNSVTTTDGVAITHKHIKWELLDDSVLHTNMTFPYNGSYIFHVYPYYASLGIDSTFSKPTLDTPENAADEIRIVVEVFNSRITILSLTNIYP